MRWVAIIAIVFVVGCKEKDREAAKDVAGKAKDKTVEVAGEAKDKILEVAGGAKDRLGEVAGAAKENVGRVVDVTGDVVDGALVKGRAAKAELDKVYKAKHDYAIVVDDVDAKAAVAHAERLDKMPSVEVKGMRVGYEEDSVLSLRGTSYTKHFRASWKRGDGKIVRVSFFTQETIDVVAFAALLGKIVPAVEAIL